MLYPAWMPKPAVTAKSTSRTRLSTLTVGRTAAWAVSPAARVSAPTGPLSRSPKHVAPRRRRQWRRARLVRFLPHRANAVRLAPRRLPAHPPARARLLRPRCGLRSHSHNFNHAPQRVSPNERRPPAAAPRLASRAAPPGHRSRSAALAESRSSSTSSGSRSSVRCSRSPGRWRSRRTSRTSP